MRSAGLLIPKVFHRIWLGGPLPDEYVAFGESFQRCHPQWQMILWDETNLPPLRNQQAFAAATSLAQKADIARYELLYRQGGIYLDTDFECRKSLEPLLDGVRSFAATEDERWISIGIMPQSRSSHGRSRPSRTRRSTFRAGLCFLRG